MTPRPRRAAPVTRRPRVRGGCETGQTMKKQLPEAVKARTPSEKIIWMYIDRWPGEHSVRSLYDALGVTADRALPALVRDGLLIQETAPAGSRLGQYRAVMPQDGAKKA